MFNFYYIKKRNIKGHNPSLQQIFDHPYRILIAGGSGSRKTNVLLNLIKHIDKTYLYAKDPYKAKYKLLTYKRKITDKKYLNDSKAFIKYSKDIDDIYKNIEQ